MKFTSSVVKVVRAMQLFGVIKNETNSLMKLKAQKNKKGLSIGEHALFNCNVSVNQLKVLNQILGDYY